MTALINPNAALILLICALIAGFIGNKKGNPIAGFLMGLLLGPIGILIAFLSGDKKRRACPHCAEKILKQAKICPFCRQAT